MNSFYLPQDWAGDIFVDDVYSAVYDVISDIFGDNLDNDNLHAIVIDRDGDNDSGTKFCMERTSYFVFGGIKTKVQITFCYPKSNKKKIVYTTQKLYNIFVEFFLYLFSENT